MLLQHPVPQVVNGVLGTTTGRSFLSAAKTHAAGSQKIGLVEQATRAPFRRECEGLELKIVKMSGRILAPTDPLLDLERGQEKSKNMARLSSLEDEAPLHTEKIRGREHISPHRK